MRRLKFRAWDKKNKGWVVDIPLDLVIWIMINHSLKERKDIFLLDIEFTQFIGIKDKNGNEIYEGDIIKYRNRIRQVEYSNENYSFQMDLSDYVLDQESGYDEQDIEVIGNIYENLELLKDKNVK